MWLARNVCCLDDESPPAKGVTVLQRPAQGLGGLCSKLVGKLMTSLTKYTENLSYEVAHSESQGWRPFHLYLSC